MDDYHDSAKCSRCGHWSPVGNPCHKCGSPLDLDAQDIYKNKGIVACGYCGHWAVAKTECNYCGAPVDPPSEDFYVDYDPDLSTPYYMDGGISATKPPSNVHWLMNGALDE